MKPGGKVAQRKAQADLEAQRERLGIVRSEEYRGLVPGDPIRLKRAGTGSRVLEFRAHYRSTRRGTEWVDAVDVDVFRGEDGKPRRVTQVIPVRPDQVVVVRKP